MKKIIVITLCLFCIVGCANNNDKPVKQKQKTQESKVSFVGVGDNLIHDTIYKQAQQSDGSYDFTPMYSNVKKDIEKADISFINQETILGGSELGLSGYPMFNSPSEIAKNLKDTGFNLVNLATNHCLDKSQQGIDNALAAFKKQSGMTFNGIYDSNEAYQQIPTFKKEGITFSFLAYTYGTNGIEAPNNYSVSYFEDEKIIADVAAAKKVSDAVIVSAHWGEENEFAPSDYQKHFAQLFASLGVDVVIGTHPHVIQPIEWLNGQDGKKTLVAYSLGNFLGGMLSVDNAISGMLKFDFVKDKKTKKINIENVVWEPLIIHFEGDQNNILENRSNYKVYKVSDYTDKLAENHVLNGFEGNTLSLEYIDQREREVIDSQFFEVQK